MGHLQWQSRLRKCDRQDIAALKAAHRDPADLDQKVMQFRIYLAQKKAGRLPMYEKVIPGRRPAVFGGTNQSEVKR